MAGSSSEAAPAEAPRRRRLRGPGSGSGAASAEEEAPRRGLWGWSSNPIVQALEHRAPGHSPGFSLRGTGRGREGPGQERRSCPELSRSETISRASRPCRLSAQELLQGLNPGFQSWLLSQGLFLLGPHGVNNPH